MSVNLALTHPLLVRYLSFQMELNSSFWRRLLDLGTSMCLRKVGLLIVQPVVLGFLFSRPRVCDMK